MLFFAHLGITLATAFSIKQALVLFQKRRIENAATPRDKPLIRPANSLFSEGMSVKDILYCSLGSLLPDIIDKPLGHYLFKGFFGNNGRIFSHTLLFAFCFLIFALFIFKIKKKVWGFYLAFGVFMHLVLDFLWQTPGTLLWPFLGWSFPHSGEYDWLGNILKAFINNPSSYWLEIGGLLVTLGFMLAILRRSFRNRRKNN